MSKCTCNIAKKAVIKTIPRGYRNKYIPCWDAECKPLYKTFLQSPQGDNSSSAATASPNKHPRGCNVVTTKRFRGIHVKLSSLVSQFRGNQLHLLVFLVVYSPRFYLEPMLNCDGSTTLQCVVVFSR